MLSKIFAAFSFHGIYKKFLEHPFLVLFATALMAVLGALAIPQTRYSVSIQDMLDPRLESTQELEAMQESFGSTEVLVASFRSDRFTNKELCKLEVGVNDLLFFNNNIENFSTPLGARTATYENGIFSYPRLIPNTCEGEIDQPLLRLKDSPWNVSLTNPTGTDYSVFITLSPLEQKGTYGSFDPFRVEKLMQKMESLAQEVGVSLSWTGNVAQGYFNYIGSTQNNLVNMIATLVLLVGLRLFYGTWLSGLLLLVTLMVNMLIVFGGLAFTKHPLGTMEACLFLLVMIATLGDFIFLSSAMVDEPEKTWDFHFKNLMIPSFFTSLTTAIGFASLMISEVSLIQVFGFWTAVASMIEWMMVFLVLPCLLKVFRIKTWVKPEQRIFKNLNFIGNDWTPSRRFTKASLLIIAIPILFFSEFNLTQTPTEMFSPDHIFQTSLRQQQKEKGWTAFAHVVFDKSFDSKRKAEIIQLLEAEKEVLRVETLESTIDFIIRSLKDPGLIDLAKFQITTSQTGQWYITSEGEERASVYLKSSETSELYRLRELVRSKCPEGDCRLVGEYIAFADFSTKVIRTLFESLFVSLILVGIVIGLLAIKFRVQSYAALFFSIIWGPAFVLTVILAGHLTINFVSCIVASILVGLAGDNAIQYLYAGKGLSLGGIQKRSDASIICTILMASLALVFTFSYFLPPRSLGFLLALGFLGNLFGDLWILKGLLKKDH